MPWVRAHARRGTRGVRTHLRRVPSETKELIDGLEDQANMEARSGNPAVAWELRAFAKQFGETARREAEERVEAIGLLHQQFYERPSPDSVATRKAFLDRFREEET